MVDLEERRLLKNWSRRKGKDTKKKEGLLYMWLKRSFPNDSCPSHFVRNNSGPHNKNTTFFCSPHTTEPIIHIKWDLWLWEGRSVEKIRKNLNLSHLEFHFIHWANSLQSFPFGIEWNEFEFIRHGLCFNDYRRSACGGSVSSWCCNCRVHCVIW